MAKFVMSILTRKGLFDGLMVICDKNSVLRKFPFVYNTNLLFTCESREMILRACGSFCCKASIGIPHPEMLGCRLVYVPKIQIIAVLVLPP